MNIFLLINTKGDSIMQLTLECIYTQYRVHLLRNVYQQAFIMRNDFDYFDKKQHDVFCICKLFVLVL